MRRRVLGMILAGGRGARLEPLTRHRSKPAVPFGGIYRIIDFVLSNFVNSGIRSIYVLTQFKSQSLTEHLYRAWAGTNLRPGNFIIPVPAQMQTPGAIWYEGTADAIWQNLNLVRETEPDLVCVFGGDHIYFMDVSRMLREHLRQNAEVTIAAIPVARADASRFGVLETEASGRVRGFCEKADDPPTMPGDPERCHASMGNYIFDREVLIEVLEEDAADPASTHDFGRDILPRMVAAGRAVHAYDFETNRVPGWEGARNTYWRDVGTVEAYYEANLDLKEAMPQLDLYNEEWRINTVGSSAPPAKFVQDADGRPGEAVESVLGAGTIVSGGTIRNSIVGRNVRVYGNAEIEESILNEGVTVGPNSRIRRAIIDKDVVLVAGTEVGYDAAADRDRGWWVTETGITVVPKSPVTRPITTLDL
ncbi:MAG: glucose-1-phosphate adenylyltransferase [Planctomycetota bacterium]